MAHRFKHLRHESMRSWLEAREGQQVLSLVHGWTRAALDMTGAVRAGALLGKVRDGVFALVGGIEDEDLMACLERLVELGELRELTVLVTVDADRVFIRENRTEEQLERSERSRRGWVTARRNDALRETREAAERAEPPRGPLTAEEQRRVDEHVQFMPPEGRSRADRLMLQRLEWEAEQARGETVASSSERLSEHEPPQGDSWQGATVLMDDGWKGRDS